MMGNFSTTRTSHGKRGRPRPQAQMHIVPINQRARWDGVEWVEMHVAHTMWIGPVVMGLE